MYSSGCSVGKFVSGCRERPSTHVTEAVVENMDYSDPVFPPNQQVQQRNGQPGGNAVEVLAVNAVIDDNDGGGVAA